MINKNITSIILADLHRFLCYVSSLKFKKGKYWLALFVDAFHIDLGTFVIDLIYSSKH